MPASLQDILLPDKRGIVCVRERETEKGKETETGSFLRAESLTVLIRHFSRFLIALIGPYSNKISMQEEIRTPCSCLLRASGLILISLLYLSPFPQHCQNHFFQFRYNINPLFIPLLNNPHACSPGILERKLD